MSKETAIQLFEDKQVRSVWDTEQKKWYISIVDVLAVLSESVNPNAYWRKLEQRLKEEGNKTVTNCHGLKIPAADGKMRLTDVADTEQLFRLIQFIPSPKAEPFKIWLAQIGAERLDEMHDPELTIDRALEQYLKLGYSENWINQRLKSVEILNMMAEASTKDIPVATNPEDFEERKKVAQQGDNVAKVTRLELEAKIGNKVVTSLKAKDALNALPKESKSENDEKAKK